jgi:hypothetical protein
LRPPCGPDRPDLTAAQGPHWRASCARSASTKGNRADTTSARSSCPAQRFWPLLPKQKWFARVRERNRPRGRRTEKNRDVESQLSTTIKTAKSWESKASTVRRTAQ